jgi:hypothetical protein
MMNDCCVVCEECGNDGESLSRVVPYKGGAGEASRTKSHRGSGQWSQKVEGELRCIVARSWRHCAGSHGLRPTLVCPTGESLGAFEKTR